MPAIQRSTATVYLAPTKGRRYLTARGAAVAEANAKLEAKYPTEQVERDNVGITYPGYHWSSEPHLVRAHKRYMRLLLRALRKES